jgi:hypothetical protein
MGLFRAIFRLREIRKILTECEWAASTGHSDYGLDPSCPYCLEVDDYGHSSKCPMGKMLDMIGREEDSRVDHGDRRGLIRAS